MLNDWMPKVTAPRIAGVVLALLVVSPAAAECTGPALQPALAASFGGQFEPMAPATAARATYLFQQHFLEPDRVGEQSDAWRALGLQVLPICDQDTEYWLIREMDEARTGRGRFVFARRPTTRLVIQVPHSRSDWGTGRLAVAFLRAGAGRAAAFNSVPRRLPGETGHGRADMAHQQYGMLQAFTEAQARALPGSRLLQLHGFDPAKRRSVPGRAATLIISAGRDTVSGPVHAAHQCLRTRLGPGTLLYPAGVQELGGTLNTQGQLYRQLAQDGFIHLELNRTLRQQLLAKDRVWQDLLECLRD